jgi:hypothetical protein
MLRHELWSHIFPGLPSRVLGFIVLPTWMDLFLQWLDSVGQPMCGHADSHQSFFLQKVDLVHHDDNLGKLEWGRLFAPSSLDLGEPAYKWREPGFVVLIIESCSVPSLERSFQRKVEEASVRAGWRPTPPITFQLAALGWYFKKKYFLNRGKLGEIPRKASHRWTKTAT